jgi:FlaA1/EpsC-like NDP-sugar epimerase
LIHGIKVFGSIDSIPNIVAQLKIEEIIIALPSAGSKAIRRAAELGRYAGVQKIKIVPSIHELIDGNVSIANIRDVEVEDLLERDSVTLDTQAIGRFIQGKEVLITGAAGSIGSELCRQVAKFNPSQLIALDQDETGIFNISSELKNNYPKLDMLPFIADICDKEKMDLIFDRCRPHVVFHAAAYKHVPLMESAPEEAVKNNIFGTKVVAETARKFGAEKFIMISTDKAVNPSSVMGATKRVCEMVCQNLNQKNSTKFISVRFGNVLNSRGSVIPIFREQIKRGGPVEVTDPEMKRYFMLTSEACLLVMQAGAMGQGGEVFVLDMGKPVKILDLAQEMIRLSGFEPDKDMPIVFIGTRPGEKLFEELLTAEEGVLATQNQKIFIAKLSRIEDEKLFAALARLRDTSLLGDREGIITVLRELLPSYSRQAVPLRKT